VIEDDTVLNQNIKESLTAEKFTVEQAYDGFIAEKLLRKNIYDCVVLDVNIPNKNGFELCQTFRTYNTSTPVLFLTAFDELDDKVQGYESGADDYLTKPFFQKELLMRIQALVKRKNTTQPQNNTLTWHDIVIKQNAKTVFRNNQELKLTPREYQILATLVSAKGEVVSKKELIREIWGSAFDANTNNIEVFINFLRNKVDKPFDKQLIKTKVGYGYYLDR
jgi:DNA-binding response OmpR family regulator